MSRIPPSAPARGRPAVSAATATASAASAGVPTATDDQRGDQSLAFEAEQEAARNGGEQQQGREGQPMAEDLGGADRFLAGAGHRQLVEHAVGAVRLDQPLDRQQGGGERRDPQDAAADPRQQPGVGPDGERRQGGDQQEEDGRQPGRAVQAPGGLRGGSGRRSRARAPAGANRAQAAGGWRPARRRRRHDARRWPAASRSAPSASRPFSGSSSSQSGAPPRSPAPAAPGGPGRSTAAGPAPPPDGRCAIAAIAPPTPPAVPEGQSAAERQFPVKRQMLVGKRRRRHARYAPQRAAAGRRRGGSGSTCRCRWGR